jgi:spore coat polysaccharide biosynthesis protein SpsF
MSDAVVILQARMASRRLPGKALAAVGGRSILARCLARLRLGAAAPVLLATTRNPEDDALEAVALAMGVSVFRGADDDVLGRFVAAACSIGARFVVRATADNPAVDIDAPARVLSAIRSTSADHVSERGLPYGAAVEAVSLAALRRADRRATMPADREHVTTLIRRDVGQFVPVETDAPAALKRPDLRLTIDTVDDLRFMRQLFERAGEAATVEPALAALIAAADDLAREPVPA